MRVHVLGPIFYSPYSNEVMERCLRQYESLGMSFFRQAQTYCPDARTPRHEIQPVCPLWHDAALSGQWAAHLYE